MRTQRNSWALLIPAMIVLILIGVVIVKGLQSSTNMHATHGNRIKIVTSLNTYGEMAKAVVGNKGSVTSVLTKATIDPHDFEPTATTARLYQQADVIISNGGGYDAWSTKLTQANEQAKAIDVGQLYAYQDGENEHFWYKADVTKRVTQALVKKLTQAQPTAQAYFEHNAQAYLNKQNHLNEVRTKVGQLLAGKTILVTEPVFNNALANDNVTIADQAFSMAVEEGETPTPTAVRAWQRLIDQGKVALVIENKQTTSQTVDAALRYAKKRGVPVVSVTETKPDGLSFAAWQTNQFKAIEKVLK